MRLLPLALIGALGGTAHAGDDDPFDGATISIQVGGGILSGVVVGGGVGLVGAGIGQLINPHNWGAPFAGAVLGFAIGASVGVVAGVDYIGDSQGANGSLLGTSLGLVGGTVVLGSVVTISERARWHMPNSILVLLGIVTLVGGPVIGYHLTAEADGGNVARIPIAGFVF